MSKYLPSKQESDHKLTRQQVYHTVYHVVKHDNSHNYAKYANAYAEQLKDELGVRYANI